MRMLLITPTTPHRGGIAQFGTLLATHLAHQHHLITWGFRRLYPRWLFPGSTLPDPSQQRTHCPVNTWLDALNPYTWWRAWRTLPSVDIIIWQWWTPFWVPFILFTTWQARRRNIPTLAICHQLVEPDANSWQAQIAMWVLQRANAVVFLGIAPGNWVGAHRRCDLPSLRAFMSDAPPTPDARQHLTLEATTSIVLFFGFVRDYKGLDTIIHAMAQSQMPYHLLIAGEWWPLRVHIDQLIHDYALTPRVHIHNHYIPNEHVATYFAASDVVVLPYRSGTVSGVAGLAQQYRVPIITSNVGALGGVGTPYATLPADNIEAWRDALDDFFRTPVAPQPPHDDGWSACVHAINVLAEEFAS